MIQTVQELIDTLEALPNKSEYVGIYQDYVLHRLEVEVSESGMVRLIAITSDAGSDE